MFRQNVSIFVLSIYSVHLKAYCIYKRRTQTRFRK